MSQGALRRPSVDNRVHQGGPDLIIPGCIHAEGPQLFLHGSTQKTFSCPRVHPGDSELVICAWVHPELASCPQVHLVNPQLSLEILEGLLKDNRGSPGCTQISVLPEDP